MATLWCSGIGAAVGRAGLLLIRSFSASVANSAYLRLRASISLPTPALKLHAGGGRLPPPEDRSPNSDRGCCWSLSCRCCCSRLCWSIRMRLMALLIDTSDPLLDISESGDSLPLVDGRRTPVTILAQFALVEASSSPGLPRFLAHTSGGPPRASLTPAVPAGGADVAYPIELWGPVNACEPLPLATITPTESKSSSMLSPILEEVRCT